ncbi:type III secretion system translocon subunit SctB [Acidovorax sp. LjRoot117]|uniref:type III secretion system translocon subunit SctB n=1 Tax=Acidovorax sp. LjRoot117 TaxID=3342255 RepID=UPI003ECFD323
MSIDGIQRAPTLAPLGDTGPTQAAGKTAGAKGYSEIDIEALLGAKGGPAGGAKSAADALKTPASSSDPKAQEAALNNLGGFSDTQVTADIFAFMALFQKLAQQMRDTARTQRTTDMQAQVSSLQNAAEKMKDAAAERLTAAIVQGSMQIAGGVMQMGLSGMSAKQTIKGAQMEAAGGNNMAQISKMDAQGKFAADPVSKAQFTTASNNQIAAGKELGAVGTKYQGYAQASGSISGGLGGIIGATFTHKADLLDADKMNLETQAKVAETGVQHANDMMQQMMDVIRDVREKLSSIQQASIETNRGIARNI